MLIRKCPKCGELFLTKESHPEFISRMAFFESVVYQTFPGFMQSSGGLKACLPDKYNPEIHRFRRIGDKITVCYIKLNVALRVIKIDGTSP